MHAHRHRVTFPSMSLFCVSSTILSVAFCIQVFGNACLNLCLWDSESIGPTSVVNGVYTYVLSQTLPAVGWCGVYP